MFNVYLQIEIHFTDWSYSYRIVSYSLTFENIFITVKKPNLSTLKLCLAHFVNIESHANVLHKIYNINHQNKDNVLFIYLNLLKAYNYM